MKLDNRAKRTHFCIPMATLNNFILLTATFASMTVQRQRTVTFPWQQRLRERATMLRCTYHILSILFKGVEISTSGDTCTGHEMYVPCCPELLWET